MARIVAATTIRTCLTRRDNVGVYHGVVADRDKIAKLMVPTQGWGGHFQVYKPGPMPVAVV